MKFLVYMTQMIEPKYIFSVDGRVLSSRVLVPGAIITFSGISAITLYNHRNNEFNDKCHCVMTKHVQFTILARCHHDSQIDEFLLLSPTGCGWVWLISLFKPDYDIIVLAGDSQQ